MKKRNTVIKQAKSNYVFISIVSLIVLIDSLLLLIPLFWVIIESFNDYYSFIMNPFSFPSPENFSELFANYKVAWEGLYWVKNTTKGKVLFTPFNMIGYSLIISSVSTAYGIFTSVCVSYVISKYKHWKISKVLTSMIVFFIVFPGVGSLASTLQLRRHLGLYDNLLPFLLTGATGMDMMTLIFVGSLNALSNDYRDAASIDGAGQVTIMFRIFLPMIFPVIFAYFMIHFIGAWNNYELTFVWLPSYPNLAYGVYMFQLFATKNGTSVPEILAGFIIVAIPTTILWMLSQKVIMSKMAIGGLKG